MKIGIIICDRYKSCDGGKCFRAVRNREGAFRQYTDEKTLEVVSYTTCGGCPGGNVENVASGMKKYGAQAIHFATGVLAGYPPCFYLDVLKKFIEETTGLPVIVGTHPMPTNYINMHKKLGDWSEVHKKMLREYELTIPEEAVKYDSSLPSYGENLQKNL
ncbi:MAG: CGGC domain-containing protein [Candidatus Odinarchaeota archaeon]